MKAHEIKLEIVGTFEIRLDLVGTVDTGGPDECHEQVRWSCSCDAFGPGHDIVSLARHGANRHLARVTR